MSKNIFHHYFKKKSKWSIAMDIIFVILIISIIIPKSRVFLSSTAIRLFSFGPSVNEEMMKTPEKLSPSTIRFTFYDENGLSSSLAELDDKPVFYNLWASWCPPCLGEMPSIQKLYADYKDKVNFVFLNDQNPTMIRNFVDQKGWDMPLYFFQTLPDELNSRSIPFTMILNKGGGVVLKHEGAANWNSKKVRDLLDQLIDDK